MKTLPSEDWYALLKYASAYIGSNMHPIVVCLHNHTPCYSIDSWGTRNFFGHYKNDGSSKVFHILKTFSLQDYITPIENGKCSIDPDIIIDKIIHFPSESVATMNMILYERYEKMMNCILNNFTD